MKIYLFLLFFLSTYTNILLGKEIETYYLVRSNTTLYNTPSYTNKSYNDFIKSKVPKLLNEIEVADLIPKRLAFLLKGERVKKIGDSFRSYSGEDFIYVEYIKDQANKGKTKTYGWISKQSLKVSLRSPRKKVLNKTENLPIIQNEEGCDDSHSQIVRGTFELKNLKIMSNFIDYTKVNPNPFRSLSEIKKYTAKFSKDCLKKYSTAFNNEYAHYINEAAIVFEVPVTLLACSLFVESQWKSNARSHTGARGVGQFIQSTSHLVSTIIKSNKYSQKKLNRHKSDIQKYEKRTLENKKLKAAGKKPLKITFRMSEDYAYGKNELYNYSLSMKWSRYFKKLQSFKPFMSNSKYANKAPTVFSHDVGTQLAPNAIGAAALYYRYIIDFTGREAPRFDLKNDQQLNAFVVSIGGAYNRGHGSLANYVRRSGKQNPDAWRAFLAHAKETRKHMINIHNCMNADPYAAQVEHVIVNINGKKKTKIVDQRACKKLWSNKLKKKRKKKKIGNKGRIKS